MPTKEIEKQLQLSNTYFTTREICPACGSRQFRTLYQSAYDKPPIKTYLEAFYASRGGVEFEYLKGADYILCKCNECNLVYQKDIPNDELMERLYEHWINPELAYERHLKKDKLEHFAFYAREIMQVIAFFNRQPSSLKFFDFGMGWGKWALMAKAFGCDSYGTELSQQRITYALANGIKVITWEQIPQNQFDFINTEQVFEHIPEPLETLRHLKKGLKAGGVVKISVPTDRNMDRKLKVMDWTIDKGSKGFLNAIAPLEHINCYTPKTLIKMANVAGLEEVVIPMKTQYQYSLNWYGLKNIAKNLIAPINSNIRKTQNYLFFQNKG